MLSNNDNNVINNISLNCFYLFFITHIKNIVATEEKNIYYFITFREREREISLNLTLNIFI